MWFKDLVLGSEDSFYINLITLESFIALLTWVRKGVDDLRPGKVLESFTPG